MDNREFYLALTDLVAANRDNPRSLEDFLRTLRASLVPSLDGAGLDPQALVEAVAAAYSAPVPAVDAAWRQEDLRDTGVRDADSVDRYLKAQVLDMEDAAASGALSDDMRYFGRDVGRPAGVERITSSYYYNWTPAAYVECGVAGAFGGWQPGDGTARVLVPGDVAVLTDEGITSLPAEAVERPVEELPLLSWEQVCEFLWCGQSYE